jgi:ligand-binding sensor domain-containing protein
MSDGIWENSRAMEKYWKSLDYGTDANGYIWLEDKNGVCADVYDFFANKIKKIIQIEIEDGNKYLMWSRLNGGIPHYMHGRVTVGECYELYELLKGRDTSKYSYTKFHDYEISFAVGAETATFKVSATNQSDALAEAQRLFWKITPATIKTI